MPESPTRVYDLGAAILAAIQAAYVTAGVALPDRAYVAEGPPAYDCEQIVVAFTRMYPGLPFRDDPTAPVLKAVLLRSVTFAVHVVRCIPVVDDYGNAPSAEMLDGTAAAVLTDAYLLPTSVVKAWHAGDLSGTCDEFGVREVVPAEPSGGFGGTIMQVDAQF